MVQAASTLARVTTTVRRLGPADLSAYKTLRDQALKDHPDAFVSDFESERLREPESYLGRLGLAETLGGTFLLGAFTDDGLLVGSIGLERSTMSKTRHRADVIGLMVSHQHTGQGTGRRLIHGAIAMAKEANGLRLLTATITISNDCVERLYVESGFRRYGLLPRALRVQVRGNDVFFDKAEMVLSM